MKKFISILKKIGDVLLFCLGLGGTETEKEATENDLISREGQGRDKHGK